MRYVWIMMCLAPLLLSGCSVGMAMSGEEQKDASIAYPGAPRTAVIAKLGPPEATTTNDDGTFTDSWIVVKGNKSSGGRAAMHAGLDVLTIGLWEVVGTPLEMGASHEDRRRLIVTYDHNQNVVTSQAIPIAK